MEIVQVKSSYMDKQGSPFSAQPSSGEADIELLLEQYQVVRILQPDLRRQVEETVHINPSLRPYILSHQNEIYLVLTDIRDPQRRQQSYDLVQRYQIDPAVELDKLPDNLRVCLQAQKHRQGRFMGAFALGALAGVLIGLIGMALSVLLTAVLGVPGNNWEMVTAVTFVVCSGLGWAAATYYLWHKYPLGFWRN